MFFFFFLMFLYFFFVLICSDHFFSSSFNFLDPFFNDFNVYDFSLVFDFVCLFFFSMVLLVTSLVSLYCGVYMDFYNNKKFVMLLLFFFVSMMVLSFSGSFIFMMIGWDFLGITSICLIMFYPNKVTFFNSLMTMFFNRMGDVFLIICLGILLYNFSIMFYGLDFFSISFFFILFFCGLTKSAQFPLSSWLPAAMSAPTPISAMVHSSTLVTAGIFLYLKIMNFLLFFSITEILCVFSSLTFILGGFMANLETDLKKIVAFSTMSQISMIIFLVSSSLLSMGVMHMMFHALFKTLLFCSSGLVFLTCFSNQNFLFVSFNSKDLIYCFFFLLSIYSMSGLTFSSSFFTKDLGIELVVSDLNFFLFFILIVGSMLTLFYCCKLLWSCSYSPSKVSYFLLKSSFFFFLLFFSMITSYSFMIFMPFFLDSCPFLDEVSIFMVNLFFLFVLFNDSILVKFNKLMLFFSDILFSKNFSFSIYGYFFYSKLSSDLKDDQFFFKSNFMNIPKFFFNFNSLSFYFFMPVLTIFLSF